ncbi:MAG TPA: hypothetical protein VK911_05570 [Vicinamibacterales bacterium]|nr:hypothetical protein [Vicinamibacterales bacterium]
MNRSVDDLRARLRDLGYLDAGVDRFVLGAASGGRGRLAIAGRASARIGLIAALLLGPSAAIALGVRLPGLIAGMRDAIVLTLYLSALFGVAVGGSAFGISLLLGTLVSRIGGTRAAAGARTFARAAGLLVGVGCLVYLVLWWRAVSPAGSISLGGAATLLVLGWTAGVSVLLGHAVRLTTLALIARSGESPFPSLRLRAAGWRGRTALLAAAFLGAAGLTWAMTRSEPAGPLPGPPAFAAHPTGVKLTLVALDGVDLPFVERLRERGRLPVLGPLLAGARVRFAASDAPDPARTWTSLATGLPADVHGVGAIEARRVSGLSGRAPVRHSGLAGSVAAVTDLVRLTRPALTTGMERRTKTLWEVAAESGLDTLVVNWWATWPADGPGEVLSDRTVLRLERGGALDGEVAPAGLYPRLQQAWPRLRDEAARRVMEAFPGAGEPRLTLRRAALQDALPVALAALLGDGRRDLEVIYLPGLDIAQFELLVRPGSTLPPSALAARVEALEQYYVFLDALLRSVVSREGRLVAVLADPGRSPASRVAGVPARSTDRVAGDGESALPGLLALGPGHPAVRAGADLRGDRSDILPTLLYALGVPVSRQLPGRPLTAAFDPAFAAAHRPVMVEGYGLRTVAPRPSTSAPLDQEMLDRLRSLGYLR